jgi:DNA (cytosine-5)-methyltransferase 1
VSKLLGKKLRVVELFAGVGGFRIGFDRASKGSDTGFETVWASQWEPASGKNQHAAWVYNQVFFRSKGVTDDAVIRSQFSNEDINKVVNDPKLIKEIPDHDVLCGGFPCQDYSVARPLSQAAGLEGKKGVLWWSIYKILENKKRRGKPVPYLFLENVDRLLKSPSSQRGRDFAIMLSSLNKLGYIVEWRVINAGEYGFPQRRRRTFILGYYKDSEVAKQFAAEKDQQKWTHEAGLLANAFPHTRQETLGSFDIDKDPVQITERFDQMNPEGEIDGDSPFQNAGMMVDGHVVTMKVRPAAPKKTETLGAVVAKTNELLVEESYYIRPSEKPRWEAQKGAHEFDRISKGGHKYHYTEGALPFPDHLDRPSRTIITSEGGRTATRFKHVVDISEVPGKGPRKINGERCSLRRLVPEELEALCMFDRGHTKKMFDPFKHEEVDVSDAKRAFFMGNALVVGVIKKIGEELLRRTGSSVQEAQKPGVRRAKDLALVRVPK